MLSYVIIECTWLGFNHIPQLLELRWFDVVMKGNNLNEPPSFPEIQKQLPTESSPTEHGLFDLLPSTRWFLTDLVNGHYHISCKPRCDAISNVGR